MIVTPQKLSNNISFIRVKSPYHVGVPARKMYNDCAFTHW